MLKTAVAIRHVQFEDLGSFEEVLERRGYRVHYYDAGVDPLWTLEPVKTELLVVLGGPIGAYEEAGYPFLEEELRLLQARLAAGRPTMGICLGAQLMARALGAKVYPGPWPEIGFAPIRLTAEGRESCLAPFAEEGATVLHWHGDTFDLPDGAVRLASTAVCRNQAFAWGRNAIAFQFHPEARLAGFERWLIGHACEIARTEGVTVPGLRADADRHAPAIEERAARCLSRWLDGLDV
ncbi:glutamine amidotransferase [Azospirillum thermophilum]|uniref:Glutamine amidotransferase n=1 Tax=Azospirillum thermophilum TaxID=2202148 RepID=A0A2S2CLJ0_9PROT|nr:glutamine amidotransferase [Azospirillum thermophilum]AWK85177.1 glutamine amidotransferase [Azospirillum thermophilum]